MAVPEQTPFIEYTANGTTTVYPLTFDCDKSEYLIVSLDGEEAPVGSWSLAGGSITFNTAPANGVLITIERNTPFRRTTEYQSYNNSFRPSPVNKDFDLIWWKLQELGYRDQVIWLALVKEIADRIAGDTNLQNQINTIDEWLENLQQNVNKNTNDIAQLVTDLSKEIADRIKGDQILKDMFLSMIDEAINEGTINALAITHLDTLEALEGVTNVWDGRTIYVKDLGNYRYDALTTSWVKAYQDADNVKDGDNNQSQINNLIKFKTNWVVSVEQFGGLEGQDNSAAFQDAYNYLKSVGGGTLTSNIRHHIIGQTVKYYDNITTDLNFAEVEILTGGRFSGAIYNADRSTTYAPTLAEIYYKNQQSLDAGNPISRITTNATIGATSVVVENASGFQVGDLIFFNNGYCDMWRVMEQYNGSYQNWVNEDVALWRCEIQKIKNIVGNTIYLESQLSNNYLTTVETYGFFPDENNRADHQGWNYARIERLGGVSNCTFKNIKFKNNGASVSLLAFLARNVFTQNCTFEGTGQGVDYVTCYNSHIMNCYSKTTNFGQSIRRGSSMCIMNNAGADYVSGDCPLIIWEGSHLCIANNIVADNTSIFGSHAKIGFYFNSCWDCVGSNFTGKNVKDVVGVMFCRGGITVSNIAGMNCDTLTKVFASHDVVAKNGRLRGYGTQTRDDYTDALFSVSQSHNVKIQDFRDSQKYDASKISGRAHIFKSFAVDISEINAPNILLWNSVDDDKIINPTAHKMRVKDSKFKNGRIEQTYAASQTQTRSTTLSDTEILSQLRLDYIHNTLLSRVKIWGNNTDRSLRLTVSHFNKLVDCYIKNATYGIDFLGSGSAGNQEHSSLIYLRDTFIDAPTKFLNYVDPSAMLLSGAGMATTSRETAKVSILSNYPKLKTFANLGQAGSTTWALIESTNGAPVVSTTSANLSSSADPINTGKYLGREVYNSTISQFMRSLGSTPTSQWKSSDGATTITPV